MIDYSSFLAIDTETTGPDFHHGCRAFAVSTCNHQEDKGYWETKVNPKNRKVEWDGKVKDDLFSLISSYDQLVFHNASFDIQALELLDPRFIKLFKERELHDTMILAHILDSKGPKALKDLAILHLDIDDIDEQDLDTTVKRLHFKAKKIGWDYARKGHPQFPGVKSKFHKMDMWLPKAYAESHHFDGTSEERNHLKSVCSRYAILDAYRTAGLFILFGNHLNQDPESFDAYELQRRCLRPLIDMEKTGLHLLPGNFEREVEEYEVQAEGFKRLLQRLVQDPDFNPDSTEDLQHYLYDHFKFEPFKTTPSGEGFSTDKDSIAFCREQPNTLPGRRFVSALQRYKATNSALKYLHSYTLFHKNHYLHPNMNLVGTSTTRLSSSQPNGQNVSKGKETEQLDEDGKPIVEYSLRRVFGPPTDHHWFAIDYDQLQIRIFAFLSQEQTLIEAIRRGFDFHTTVAQSLYETETPTKQQRKTAKYINFGIIFGAGQNRISELSGDPTAYKRFIRLYPNVAEYIKRRSADARRDGFIRTASGYPLTVPRNKPYVSVNYEVQGTEGDIVKKALCDTYDFLSRKHPSTKIILQVHDEFLFQTPKHKRFPVTEICKIMEDAGTHFGVECKAKPEIITTNWAEGKELTRHGLHQSI